MGPWAVVTSPVSTIIVSCPPSYRSHGQVAAVSFKKTFLECSTTVFLIGKLSYFFSLIPFDVPRNAGENDYAR